MKSFLLTIAFFFLVYTCQLTAQTWTLTVNYGTGGYAYAWGGNTYIDGDLAYIQAEADPGYIFTGWSGDITSSSSLEFIFMNSNITVTANFTQLAQYTISASAGSGGSITPSGNIIVNSGSNQTFSIEPSSGYVVSDVKVDNVSQGAIESYSFSNVTNNHTISATFVTGTPLGDGKVIMEKWTNVSGLTVVSNDWNTTPNSTTEITSLEIPTNADDRFAVRIQGYIIPSISGIYNFYIASDDYSELWLSTDNQPSNITKIAYLYGWTQRRQWTSYSSQKSADITLTANQSYYFVIYMKEDTGGDNLSVGWKVPGLSGISLIRFTNISSTAGALPVELTSFTANVKGSNVELNWQTATEVNNYGFEIQKSEISSQNSVEKNNEWKKIGFVNGHGNSNSPKSYSFVDKNVNSGNYNYRLKQIDFDGKFEYSDVINVVSDIASAFSLSQNYPNPFNPTTKISFNIPDAVDALNTSTTLKVYDVLGREVITLINEKKSAGYYEVNFNASNLSSGIYFYKLSSGSFQQTKKMLVIK